MMFLGACSNYDKAELVIAGAPYDETVAIRPGCRFGPDRIRYASHILEDFAWEQGKGLRWGQVVDEGNVDMSKRTPLEAVQIVELFAHKHLTANKRLFWLGGEHLITAGAIAAAHRLFSDLAVVIFDAHADLRDTYEGQSWSHATVSRRIAELIGGENVYLVGVRSGSNEDYQYLCDSHITSLPFDSASIENLTRILSSRPVYLSIDIDIADPSAAPGTGSPEPGGPDARELLSCLSVLSSVNIIAADVVEVSPIHDHSDITSLLAARIVRDVALTMV